VGSHALSVTRSDHMFSYSKVTHGIVLYRFFVQLVGSVVTTPDHWILIGLMSSMTIHRKKCVPVSTLRYIVSILGSFCNIVSILGSFCNIVSKNKWIKRPDINIAHSCSSTNKCSTWTHLGSLYIQLARVFLQTDVLLIHKNTS
jgi:hypothetical protein